MTGRRCRIPRRIGLTLLEVTLAVGVMVLLLVPTIGVLQTSKTIWRGVESSHATEMQKSDGLLFIQRTLKRADEVVSLSSKRIKFRLTDGIDVTLYRKRTDLWYEDSTKKTLRIADNLKSVSFHGLLSDASTVAKTPADIRVIQVTLHFKDDAKKHDVIGWIRK